MNQLKVTGMLSRPCSPVGQSTALSVPQDALRILGSGRAIEPAAAEGKPPAPLLTLEFGIAYQEFMADWCARAEERLAVRAPTNRSAGLPADRSS